MRREAHGMDDVRGLLFDADGTLMDTHAIILRSMRHTINDVLGLSAGDAELMRGVGTPLLDQMLYFTNGDEARAAELVEVYRSHNDGLHDAHIRPFPDTLATLGRFQAAGLRMGVVTSKRRSMAERGLRMTGVLDYLDVLICSDDWPEHKPHPGPVLHGCELLGLAPAHCPYVGDSPYDLQAGAGAGCATVAALWGMFPREVLEAEHPTLTCTSLSELADFLHA